MAEASVQLNQNQQQIFNNYLRSQGLNVNDVLNTPSQPFQPTQTTTPEINAGDIGNVSPIQLPQEATRTQSVSGILSQLQGLTSGVADDSTQTALEQSLLGLTAGLEGQTEFKAQTSQELGIPEIQQQIADVSGQALRRASLLQEQIVGMEGQGAFAATTRGREARALRQASAEIQGLQATQEILKGNLEVAQSKLDQAVSLKYNPIKERIQTLLMARSLNEDKMNRQEKKLAERRQNELFIIQSQLQRAQSLENASLQELISASRLGMPQGRVSALTRGVINGSVRPEDAISEATTYTGAMDRLNLWTKQAQYNDMINQLNGSGLSADMREKIGKFEPTQQATAQINLVSNLRALHSLIMQYGTTNPMDAEARGAIQSLRSQLEVDIAVAGGQGAISDGEADRYRKIIGSSFQNKDKVLSGIQQAVNTQNGKIKSNINLVDATYPGAVNFDTFQSYFQDEEVQQIIDSYQLETVESQPNYIDAFLSQIGLGAYKLK